VFVIKLFYSVIIQAALYGSTLLFRRRPFLQDELNGYKTYSERTPYRLIPFVW
jgi:protein-S-isoprenylcysteine O-methyltransferase Ste14